MKTTCKEFGAAVLALVALFLLFAVSDCFGLMLATKVAALILLYASSRLID